jgi:hypothetical protein
VSARSGMRLIPPGPDRCQVCAVDHKPYEPHDPDSLYWCMTRASEGKPPPTWTEALEHCSLKMREVWVEMLADRGVKV